MCLADARFFIELFPLYRLVSYDGTVCTEFIATDMHGAAFRMPAICLVTPEIAASLLDEYMRTRQKPS